MYLREWRKYRGLTQEALAELLDTGKAVISRLETGQQRYHQDWIEALAKALDIDPVDLFRPPPAVRRVPVVGYVGAGAQITPAPDIAHGAALEEIDLPWPAGPEATAVIVRGDSMHPVYREGDILIYEDRHTDPAHLLGRECIVALTDGRMYVKELARGSKPGLFTLLSWNAPPIYDAAVAWAAPVRYVKRKV